MLLKHKKLQNRFHSCGCMYVVWEMLGFSSPVVQLIQIVDWINIWIIRYIIFFLVTYHRCGMFKLIDKTWFIIRFRFIDKNKSFSKLLFLSFFFSFHIEHQKSIMIHLHWIKNEILKNPKECIVSNAVMYVWNFLKVINNHNSIWLSKLARWCIQR